jgi:hypothetical protein
VFVAFAGRSLAPNVTVNQVALAAWWGIALHHYVIDERIWRIRTDAGLRKALLPEAA